MNEITLPHDVRGLIPFYDWWLWVGLPTLVCAILLFLAWLWRRRQGKQEPAEPVVVEEPRLQVLRRELANLRVPDEFPKGVQIQLYYDLSRILRGYVEEVCGLSSSDRTVPELRQEWQQRLSLDPHMVRDMLRVLERSDLIKFADVPASVEEGREALAAVHDMTKRLDLQNMQEVESERESEQQTVPVNPNGEEGVLLLCYW